MTTVPEELRRLAARRWRLAVVLTSLMMAGYFGFILLVAFDKPLAGTLFAGGRISLGIILGAAVIVLAPVLTAIYVRWANRVYDVELAALRKKHPPESPAGSRERSERLGVTPARDGERSEPRGTRDDD